MSRSATMTADQLSSPDLEELRTRLAGAMSSMSDHDRALLARERESLGDFMAQLIHDLALAMGLVLIVPVAWGLRFTAEVVDGFGDGVRKGWNDAWKNYRT